MMNKRILLAVGIVAALAIGSYAMFGWPPVKNEDTSGAIGAAKKYQSEQIADADVVLQDADIQALLQTDFFYQMVTNEDFRRLVADGTVAKLAMMDDQGRSAVPTKLLDLGKIGFEDGNFREAVAKGDHQKAADIAAAKGITSLTVGDLDRLKIALRGFDKYTVEDYGRLTGLAKAPNFMQAVAAGDFDKATTVAATEHKITVANPKELAKIGYADTGKQRIRILQDFGKLNVEDGNFREAVAKGDHQKAADIAAAKGITSLTPRDLERLQVAGIGKLTLSQWEDLGRLTVIDGFGKTLYADGFGKLLRAGNGRFKTDMAAGEVDRYLKPPKTN
jgi:hypothetical protein